MGETADAIEPEPDERTAIAHDVGEDGDRARGDLAGAGWRRVGQQGHGALANVDNAHLGCPVRAPCQ